MSSSFAARSNYDTRESVTMPQMSFQSCRYSAAMHKPIVFVAILVFLPSSSNAQLGADDDGNVSAPPTFEAYGLASGLKTIDATSSVIIRNPQPNQTLPFTPSGLASGARVGFGWRHENLELLFGPLSQFIVSSYRPVEFSDTQAISRVHQGLTARTRPLRWVRVVQETVRNASMQEFALLLFALLFEAAQAESLSSDCQQYFPRFYKTLECLLSSSSWIKRHSHLTPSERPWPPAQSGSQSAGLPRDSMTRR